MKIPLSPAGGWLLALTNLVLRLLLRRRCRSSLKVSDVRLQVKRIDRAQSWRPPAGLKHRRDQLNGLYCEHFEPNDVAPDAPVILYFPGGGFILSAMRGQRQMLADICLRSGSRALLVQYRTAPEHMLPTAQEDALSAYRALLNEPDTDPRRLFLLGDSAGGNVALSALQQARDAGLPQPAGAMLLSPATDLSFHGGKLIDNLRRDPFFDISFLLWMRHTALPEGQSSHDPLLSPAWASFTGLAPLLIEAGSTEALLDGSLLVAKRAPKEGVKVHLTVEPNAPHVYPAIGWLRQARAARQRMQHFMKQQLRLADGAELPETSAERHRLVCE